MSKVEVDPELGAAAEKPAAAARVAAAPKKVAEEEDPRLRWAFVRKVYAILALQFAFTAGLAAVACLVHPIPRFFLAGSVASWSVFITIILAPFLGMPLPARLPPSLNWGFDLRRYNQRDGALILFSAVMWPMLKYRQKHPVNLWMLALFTLCISISVAVTSSTVAGKDAITLLHFSFDSHHFIFISSSTAADVQNPAKIFWPIDRISVWLIWCRWYLVLETVLLRVRCFSGQLLANISDPELLIVGN
jgi:FtsH-binding integral membrane protein